jgi:hypothetical protein
MCCDITTGKHTVNIDLRALPADITQLFFVLSGWQGVLLKDIKNPYISFTDADLKTDLCRYDLEQKNTGTSTAVVMCRLAKDAATGQWQVLAIGHLTTVRCRCIASFPFPPCSHAPPWAVLTFFAAYRLVLQGMAGCNSAYEPINAAIAAKYLAKN